MGGGSREARRQHFGRSIEQGGTGVRADADASTCSGCGRHPARGAAWAGGDQRELAVLRCFGVRGLAARIPAVIRIDAVWLAVQPIDMRTGVDRLLASVVQVFGAAQAHHGYLFSNARASRIRLLVHDGFGVWCAARRLNQGGFDWPRGAGAAPLPLTKEQFDALVLGLPWQRLEQMRRIEHV